MHKPNTKIFILLPDGVGLRNFALTRFKEVGEEQGFDITYWNNTVFPLQEEFGYTELLIDSTRVHPKITTLSRARKRVELALSRKRFNDPIYSTYRFPLRWKGIKNSIKSLFVKYYETFKVSSNGLESIVRKMKDLERTTQRYQDCKKQLEEHKPAFVYCTTQRSTQAIAPLLAAQDLGIPTACWIFSWDNLPKGMNTVETDYYYVWSELMKEQLLQYYPKIQEDQIVVTGTPQFEPHYATESIVSKDEFYNTHNLNIDKEYICFTGDDHTTSPLDHLYLQDLAKTIRVINKEGGNYGIIFRRVPVDFSDRYDEVLKKYKEIITPIVPLWNSKGGRWDKIMPTKEDFALLANIAHHTKLVANIGSSTAFDFVIHGTPCLYFNYEQPELTQDIRGIKQCYDYVHFRSMPYEDTVVWLNAKEELVSKIKGVLSNKINPVPNTNEWYQIVNHPIEPQNASLRIWMDIKKKLA